MKLSDRELETLLAAGESDRVAFEESFQGEAPTTVRQAVCAFANDLPGHGAPGVVCLGLRHDGKPSGLTITDALLTALCDIRSDGDIVPPPLLTVEKRVLRGAELARRELDGAGLMGLISRNIHASAAGRRDHR